MLFTILYIDQYTLLRNYREHESQRISCTRDFETQFWKHLCAYSLTLSLSFRRSSVGTFIRQQPLTSSGSSSVDSSRGSKTSTTAPRLDYRSMVSVEDMPELFVSFDSKCPEELISFPELWNANIFQSVYFFGMIKSNERYIQCNRFSAHTKYLLSTFL